MAKVYFFGYGVYKSSARLREVIEHEPGKANGALLQGYDLAYQTLDQIPELPREILEKVWGQNFKSYTLTKGNGMVSGVVWEIEEEDLEKIKNWEFVNEGWREIMQVSVQAFNGQTISAYTEKALDGQTIKERVDGLNYIENLNSEGRRDFEIKEEEYEILKMRELLETRRQLAEFQ